MATKLPFMARYFSNTEDDELRAAAMHWLSMRTHDGALPLSRDELSDFRFRGVPFRLIDTTKGIRKPGSSYLGVGS